MAGLYPRIGPYEHGMLEVGDGNLVYWETCGNPHGRRPLYCTAAPVPDVRSGTAGCSIPPPIANAWELNRVWPRAGWASFLVFRLSELHGAGV